eukprot:gene894-523_t
MWRVCQRFLAEATSGTTSSTSTAGGRLIRIRKKAKWFDRRSKRVPHDGKDVFSLGEQPSCALCHVRFRYKQDYEMHKDSELHQHRLRWVETQSWWRDVGQPAHQRHEAAAWQWYVDKVLPDRAKEMGCSLEAAAQHMRQSRMAESPAWHRNIQCPPVRAEIKEPRDQRWPASPKW